MDLHRYRRRKSLVEQKECFQKVAHALDVNGRLKRVSFVHES